MTLWDTDFERDHDDVYDLAAARADLDRKRAREGRALTEPDQVAGPSAHPGETASDSGSVSAHPLRYLAIDLAELQWPNSTAVLRKPIARTPLEDRLRGRKGGG